ncbi:TGS domain-containing protein [candidate division KSB1 bacterium]|nr:TGS domain-containing protein [candidate division KSB1 bacterium]
MPANLTPQYYSAEERYKSAKDDREKLKALKEMLAVIPKHKGTEKLQADIKRKISNLKDELEGGKGKKGARRFSYSVDKEGAGQITIVGPPNSGKTTLVNAVCGTELEVADYPFTTRIFQPAMMPYEDIQFQLVDLPPVSTEYMENWVPGIVKTSDAVFLVLDFNDDALLEKIDATIELLRHHKIELIEKQKAEEDVRWTYLQSLLIGMKFDLASAGDNLQVLKEFYGDTFTIVPFSVNDPAAPNEIRKKTVAMLDIVRIYSKRPGYEPEYDNPFVFPRGDTLIDFAKAVHKDFADNLKFARVWGTSKFDGQRITKDYVLEDKDVIELHM